MRDRGLRLLRLRDLERGEVGGERRGGRFGGGAQLERWLLWTFCPVDSNFSTDETINGLRMMVVKVFDKFGGRCGQDGDAKMRALAANGRRHIHSI